MFLSNMAVCCQCDTMIEQDGNTRATEWILGGGKKTPKKNLPQKLLLLLFQQNTYEKTANLKTETYQKFKAYSRYQEINLAD